MLTRLILNGAYPPWNTPTAPSERGLKFLRLLYAEVFGDGRWPEGDIEFIDEFDLPRRHDTEKGGAPDYCVRWPDRLWIIELKTERGSHEKGQLERYFELGRHHYPDARIDLTCLTPGITSQTTPPGDWARMSHITWSAVIEIARTVWSDGSELERELLDALIDTVEQLSAETQIEWLERVAAAAIDVQSPAENVVRAALELAHETATDGKQRALEYDAVDLEALLELRLAVRDANCYRA